MNDHIRTERITSLLQWNEHTGCYENAEISVTEEAVNRVRNERYASLIRREDPDYRSEYYAADAYARNPARWHVGMEDVQVKRSAF